METHVRAIAILHLIFGGIGVVCGILGTVIFVALTALVGSGTSTQDQLGVMILLTSIGGVIFLAAMLLAVPSVILGWALLKRKPWSRMFGVVLSAIQLIHFPFGTALGAYGLWALTSPAAKALFPRR